MTFKIDERKFHDAVKCIAHSPESTGVFEGRQVIIAKKSENEGEVDAATWHAVLSFLEQNLEKIRPFDFESIEKIFSHIESSNNPSLLQESKRLNEVIKLHFEILHEMSAQSDYDYSQNGKYVPGERTVDRIDHLIKKLKANGDLTQELMEKDGPTMARLFDHIKKRYEIIKNETKSPHLDHVFEEFIDEYIQYSFDFDTSRHCKTTPHGVVLQVSPPPQESQKLMKDNLSKFITHYPNYALGENFALYDIQKGAAPEGLNHATVRKNLRAWAKDNELDASLQTIINEVLEKLKPVEIVNVCINIDRSGDREQALIVDTVESVARGNPTLISKEILANPKHFLHFKKCFFKKQFLNKKRLEDENNRLVDIYIQEKGGFALIVPKGADIQKMGFKHESSDKQEGLEDRLIKLESDLFDIPKTDFKFHRDLENLLLDDTDEKSFQRLLYISGHGDYPGTGKMDPDESGLIASVPVKDFQLGLDVLEKKKTVFACLSSCYAGGTNASFIHNNKGEIPFPILVESALEIENLSPVANRSSVELLDHMRPVLFKTSSNALPPVPTTLTPRDFRRISQMVPNYNEEEYALVNMGLFLAPSTSKNSVKITNTQPNQLYVTQINHRTPKVSTNRGQEIHVPVSIHNAKTYALMFTDPVVEQPIFVISDDEELVPSLKLVSRGGDSRHFIKELHYPASVFDQLVLYSSIERDIHEAPVAKAYAFAKLEGRDEVYRNAVFLDEPEGWTFVYKQKGKYYLQNSPVELPSEITETEAIEIMYESFARTTPSKESVRQFTAGMQSDSDFYRSINKYFWGDKPPLAAEFLSSGLAEPDRPLEAREMDFLKATLLLEDAVNEGKISNEEQVSLYIEGIICATYRNDQDKVRHLFSSLINCVPFDSSDLIEDNIELLGCAVLNNDAEMVLWIASQHVSLDEKTLFGQSAVEIAAGENNIEMLELLDKVGADMSGENAVSALRIAARKHHSKVIAWIENYAS